MRFFEVQTHRDSDNKIIGYTVVTYDKDTGDFLAISDLFRSWDSAIDYIRQCRADDAQVSVGRFNKFRGQPHIDIELEMMT